MILFNSKLGKNFWLAVFSLVGTTIGVGIFALPYVFSRPGFILGFVELLLITALMLLVQLMVGEIALRTRGKKRMLGYSALYLNKIWHRMLIISTIFAGIGSLLAYLILAGNFISILFGWGVLSSTLLFFVIWFFSILIKAKTFGKTEFYLGRLSIAFIIFIALFNLRYVNIENFLTFDFGSILLPYGVILFAITGAYVIPEMEEILSSDKSKLKKAIIFGTLIPVITYLLFVVAVVGVSGFFTTPDAISGLAQALNSKFILVIGALLGLVAVFQASLSYGIYFKETLWYDLKINKWLAWILSGSLPLLLFLLGARSFIHVIGIIGSVFLGFQFIMILWMHERSKSSETKPEYEVKLSKNIYWILAAFFGLGAILEVWYNIF